ncbi:MAG: isocitrate lyase/phosphoenolpyruvate mutase family protein [Phycisphaerales bacterium]|nr:isocitrate lyase/phosphoenolpyruvate mutase family protein [Phycisphaerales bacterium]
MDRYKQKAMRFRQLHHDSKILIIPNAWDVASARVFAMSGFPAVGTTSMGVSAALGLAEPQVISFEEMAGVVSRIVGALDVPVTADMEAGYGSTTDEIVSCMERVIDIGAVGINIEDGTDFPTGSLIDPALMSERIAAIRQRCDELEKPLVINARIDVYINAVGEPQSRLDQTLHRASQYVEAGADCIFVPGGLEEETIANLVKEIPAAVNVVANPAISVPVVPPISVLQDLGVARVSVGSGIMRATLGLIRRITDELLQSGTYDTMREHLTPSAADAYEMAIGRHQT